MSEWTQQRDALLQAEYPTTSDPRALAARLGVSLVALKTRAARLGVRRRHPWTQKQLRLLRQLRGHCTATEIAARTGRSVKSVQMMAFQLGLPRLTRRLVWDEARVRQMYADGLSDSDVAAVHGCGGRAASAYRCRLGIPANGYSERWREKLQASGTLITDGGSNRREAYRRFARSRGWPEHLPPRCVQILDLMAAVGLPVTRRQIVSALGLHWTSVRKVLMSGRSCTGGSYLAHLAHHGLLTRLKRACRVTGKGKGHSCDYYVLGPAAIEILAARAAEEES